MGALGGIWGRLKAESMLGCGWLCSAAIGSLTLLLGHSASPCREPRGWMMGPRTDVCKEECLAAGAANCIQRTR